MSATNSSPPRRATTSPWREMPCSRWPISFNISSPTSWPWLPLIGLNLSISISNSPSLWRFRAAFLFCFLQTPKTSACYRCQSADRESPFHSTGPWLPVSCRALRPEADRNVHANKIQSRRGSPSCWHALIRRCGICKLTWISCNQLAGSPEAGCCCSSSLLCLQ